MTAYRSTNTYRQDLLRYDGTVIVNVTVTPAVIAGTSTAPAVTVTEGSGVTVTPAAIAATTTAPAVTVSEGTGVTVTPGVIATAAITPAVTVEILLVVYADTITGTAALPAVTVTEGAGVTVNAATVSGSGLIPEVTVTEGTGVTVTSTVAATATIFAPNVVVGNGVIVQRPEIRCFTTIPDLELNSLIVLFADAPGALLDVLPYNVISIERRWKSRWAAPARRGKNIFILTDNTVTNRHPNDVSTISRQILGGHESPTDLSSEERTLLLNAGYSFEVR